jgi:hypothetical protein
MSEASLLRRLGDVVESDFWVMGWGVWLKFLVFLLQGYGEKEWLELCVMFRRIWVGSFWIIYKFDGLSEPHSSSQYVHIGLNNFWTYLLVKGV